MLDENLPTFIFRPMPDTPHSSVVYFTRSGSDPAPEYVLRLADPITKPACRGVYAAALTDPYNSTDVVYGEVAVKPEWQQPALSTAELRAQEATRTGLSADAAAPIPKLPESFSIQLYNPDQTVQVKWNAKSWNRTESWEFDVPIQSFKPPSTSRLDRQEEAADVSLASGPRNTFRWKRDGRLGNKDMTCYMVGRTVGMHRSKEPDITVALFKHGRDPAVTIYEPNLQRVDVQDRKGLDLVLLLGAYVIRDLYLTPKADPFNLDGAAAEGGRRRTSRAAATASTAAAAAIAAGSSSSASASRPPPSKSSGANNATTTALHNGAASSSSRPAAVVSSSSATPSAAAIDAETKRLQAMLEREERERERREREEEKRIKKMLEAEDKERRRREAEVAKETERLRKMYGMEGQELPSAAASASSSSTQAQQQQQPHRPVPPTPSSSSSYRPSHGYYMTPPPGLPQRPLSAGPRPSQHGSSSSSSHHHGSSHWWHSSSNGSSSNNSKQKRSGSGPYLNGPMAAASGLFSSSRDVPDDDRKKIQKKRSVYF